MEALPDIIEELAIGFCDYSIATRNIDNDAFQNKENQSNFNVEQVDSNNLLDNSIHPNRSYGPSCSFSDIFDDICEMDKTMGSEQAHTNSTSNSNSQRLSPIGDVAENLQSFYHMPDISSSHTDYTSDCNFSNQNDFLQPLGQWPEYFSSPPCALNNVQDIPQLASVTTPPPFQSTPLTVTQKDYPPEPATVNINLNLQELQAVSSASVVPYQILNNQSLSFAQPITYPYVVQQCVGLNTIAELTPLESNINLLMVNEPRPIPPKRHQRLQKQSCFDWAKVVPRKNFAHPSKVITLRPLRTRKVVPSRQCIDLSSYFDTSSISIPMIKERPRCNNVNRRKQDLHTKPGAEDLKFEIYIHAINGTNEDQIENDNHNSDKNNNDDQLCSENEIPELDEIFKRKRRGVGSRSIPQTQESVENSKCFSKEYKEYKLADSTTSEQSPKVLDSDSDVDSDNTLLTNVKSIKCRNCKKIFKTCRSLTIHSKRCRVIPQSPEKTEQPDMTLIRSNRSKSEAYIQNSSSKEDASKEPEIDIFVPLQKVGTRPLTRSQTKAAKRRAPVSDDGESVKKRHK